MHLLPFTSMCHSPCIFPDFPSTAFGCTDAKGRAISNATVQHVSSRFFAHCGYKNITPPADLFLYEGTLNTKVDFLDRNMATRTYNHYSMGIVIDV